MPARRTISAGWRGRAGDTRAPGAASPGARGCRRRHRAQLRPTSTHISPLPHMSFLPALSEMPAREAGARIEAPRRNAASGGAGRRAERSLEPPRRRGPPTRAPIPMPRDSVTYLINKPSGAGGKFSGAKLKSAGFAFIKRGFPKIPHGFGGAGGKGGSGTEGVSSWDDIVLGGPRETLCSGYIR